MRTIQVKKDGLLFACIPMMTGKPYKCGRCLQGRLSSWYKECKVCHAKVVKK
jgi:hypothetical protein